MAKSWCRVSVSLLFFGALVGTVAALPSSLPSTKRTMPEATKRDAKGKNIASPSTNTALLLSSMDTADSKYRISDTPINLGFTFFGAPIATALVSKTVDLAIDNISANFSHRPAESIPHGFFQQRYNDLEINVYQCSEKPVTWSTLNQLLLSIQYFTRTFRNSRVLDFEFDMSGMGRAGHGSLQYTVPYGFDLAKRAVVETLPRKPDLNISQMLQSNSSHPLLLPIFKEEQIVFSFYSFGRAIPETALITAFELARHAISTNVRIRPNEDVPGRVFKYQPDHSRVEFVVEADMGNGLTWLLLIRVLTKLAANRWSRHVFREFNFEFELPPFEESYGRGSVRYLPQTSGHKKEQST